MEEFRVNGQTYLWNPESKKIYIISHVDNSQNYTGKKASSLEEAKKLVGNM